MQHLDEGTIHAWIDGEIPPAEREALEAHIASCAQCAAAVAEARGFVAASSRILMALDAVPGGVLPAGSSGSSTSGPAVRRRFVASRAWMAAAAVLVLSTVTVIATRQRGDSGQLRVATVTQDQKEVPANAAPAEEKSRAMKPGVGAPGVDSHAVGAVGAVAPVAPASPSASSSAASAASAAPEAANAVSRNAPMRMQSRAAAPADEPKSADQTERLKSRLEAERQSTRVRSSNGAPPAMADAASAPNPSPVSEQPAAPPSASAAAKDLADKREDAVSRYDSSNERRLAAGVPGVTVTGRVTSEAGAPLASASVLVQGTSIATITGRDGSYSLLVPSARANGQTTSLVARLIGYKAAAVPIAPADTPITHDFVLAAQATALQQVVVSGEGTASASEKLGAVTGSNESPVVTSRGTSTEAGDTVVTTVYAVTGGTVTLIERSASRHENRQQKRSPGFSDQVMAKAQASAPIDSITWSDSAGHMRTLRGAVPRADLERIRLALFGATP